jgi:hypothetical protein
MVAALTILLLPARAAHSAGAPANSRVVVPGAFHVHTDRSSDSSGTIEDAAAAAERAGLRFVVATEHGDGTRTPLPPAYHGGVLWIDGVEVSTSDGHYATAGMTATPYPLGGEARDVVEDVRRFGGFGVAAHGDSLKSEAQWREWSARIDGLEWLNLDSSWREAGPLRLARAVLTYWWRPPETLATLTARPDSMLARFDALSQSRRLIAVASPDTHGGAAPSYQACFATFSTNVELEHALTNDAAADAAAILRALRAGHHYTTMDALGAPQSFHFEAQSTSRSVSEGDAIADGESVTFSGGVVAPPGATSVLIRNGVVAHEAKGNGWQFQADGARAVYRVEVRIPGAPGNPPIPWIVSNPIYVGVFNPPPQDDEASGDPLPETDVSWRPETDSSSHADVIRAPSNGVTFRFGLGGGPAIHQFAAAAGPKPPVFASSTAVTFSVRASRPLRFTVQLRQAGDKRWLRSIYADETTRDVTVKWDDMRPAAPNAEPHPAFAKVDDFLFIVDTTNTAPGTSGEIEISGITFRK